MQPEIISLIAEELGFKPEEVKLDSQLVFDLGMDELDAIELTMHLEEEFEIEILEEDVEKFETVKDVIASLTEKKKGGERDD